MAWFFLRYDKWRQNWNKSRHWRRKGGERPSSYVKQIQESIPLILKGHLQVSNMTFWYKKFLSDIVSFYFLILGLFFSPVMCVSYLYIIKWFLSKEIIEDQFGKRKKNYLFDKYMIVSCLVETLDLMPPFL